MTDELRNIDRRIRHYMRGTETVRATVHSTPVGRMVSVLVGGAILPAIVPALPVTLVVGMVVELERPRGVTGQLQVVRVLGAAGSYSREEVDAIIDALP